MTFLCPAVESGMKLQFNILEALRICVQTWELVTPRTIARYFRHAGFNNPAVTVSTPEDEEEESLPLPELVQRRNSVGRVNEFGWPFTPDTLAHGLAEVEGFPITGIHTTDEFDESGARR